MVLNIPVEVERRTFVFGALDKKIKAYFTLTNSVYNKVRTKQENPLAYLLLILERGSVDYTIPDDELAFVVKLRYPVDYKLV